jgi:hypothetical protein
MTIRVNSSARSKIVVDAQLPRASQWATAISPSSQIVRKHLEDF